AAGQPDRAGDAVAGDQLAAANLRGGDVDILIGGVGRSDAQERGSVTEQLDHALGDACGVVLLDRHLGPLGAARRSLAATAGAGAAPGLLLGGGRLALRLALLLRLLDA